MSRCRAVKRQSGMSKAAKGDLVCRVTLEDWQGTQDRQNDLTADAMPVHTKRRRMARSVALPPAWLRPW